MGCEVLSYQNTDGASVLNRPAEEKIIFKSIKKIRNLRGHIK